MPADAALKKLFRLALSPAYYPGDAVPTTYTQLWFEDCRPNCRREQVNQQVTAGGMGTLSQHATNVRNNRFLAEPELAFKPSITEWPILLPWLMNGTPSGTGTITYPLGQIGSRRTVVLDDTQKVWTMAGVQCARWSLNAQAGGEVTLNVSAAGMGWSTTVAYPTVSRVTYAADRLLAGDNVISATGITDPIRWRSLTIECDHGLNNDRFFGTFTSAGPINTNRVITVRLELPWALSQQMWAAGAGLDGLPMSIGFVLPTLDGAGVPTGQSKSLTFNFSGVKAPLAPVEPDDPEAFITWEGLAVVQTAASNTPATYGAESEMTAVLDLTP